MDFDVTIIDNRAEWLATHGKNITSQFGEDGYIGALFGKIGVRNRWCFEVGAHDGLYLSNTKWMRDVRWNCVLIEAEAGPYERLAASVATQTNVQTINRRITPDGADSLDEILMGAGAPPDLDFGCIDIDGQDYNVWAGMQVYKPRVMLVEFSPYGSPDDTIETSHVRQAGLNPIVELGKSKGYVPLLHSYCNALFVREDAWQQN